MDDFEVFIARCIREHRAGGADGPWEFLYADQRLQLANLAEVDAWVSAHPEAMEQAQNTERAD